MINCCIPPDVLKDSTVLFTPTKKWCCLLQWLFWVLRGNNELMTQLYSHLKERNQASLRIFQIRAWLLHILVSESLTALSYTSPNCILLE